MSVSEPKLTKATGALATTGRSFYSWATLGSFAGAATAVNIVWVTLKSLEISWAGSYLVPLITSLCIMAAYGILSEPDERTTWWQRGQKTVQGLMNGLLIYSAVIGISVTVA